MPSSHAQLALDKPLGGGILLVGEGSSQTFQLRLHLSHGHTRTHTYLHAFIPQPQARRCMQQVARLSQHVHCNMELQRTHAVAMPSLLCRAADIIDAAG